MTGVVVLSGPDETLSALLSDPPQAADTAGRLELAVKSEVIRIIGVFDDLQDVLELRIRAGRLPALLLVDTLDRVIRPRRARCQNQAREQDQAQEGHRRPDASKGPYWLGGIHFDPDLARSGIDRPLTPRLQLV